MIPLIYVAAIGAALLLTDGHRIVQSKQLVVSNKRKTDVVSKNQKRHEKNLWLCGSALVAQLATPVFYPLHIFAMTLLSRVTLDIATTGYESATRQHRPTVELLDALISGACIWTGQWLILSVSGILTSSRHLIVARAESASLQALTDNFTPLIHTVRLQTKQGDIYMPITQIQQGDRLVIKTGEMIPVDGVVATGSCIVDECQELDEYVEKNRDDFVSATMTVKKGEIVMIAAKSGKATIISELSTILSTTKESTLALEAKGEEVANFLAPANFILGIIMLPFVGADRAAAIWNAVPTTHFRLIVPIAVLQQVTALAELGIIVKDGRSLTRLSKTTVVVLDKVGTITEEKMVVTEIVPQSTVSKMELLSYAASLEINQSHPIACSIIDYAKQRSTVTHVNFTDVKTEIGYGVYGQLEQDTYRIGSLRFVQQAGATIDKATTQYINQVQSQGASCVCLTCNQELLGIFTLMPKIRDKAFAVIKALKQEEVKVILISGDHHQPTKVIADILGIEEYVGECLPPQKAQFIAELQTRGETVCYVGDGINDIEAIQQASTSISLSNVMNIAQDSADIVYVHSDLPPLMPLIKQAKQHIQTMQSAMHTTVIPSPIIILGATFLGMGLLGSLVINQAGVLYAMNKLRSANTKENLLTTLK